MSGVAGVLEELEHPEDVALQVLLVLCRRDRLGTQSTINQRLLGTDHSLSFMNQKK